MLRKFLPGCGMIALVAYVVLDVVASRRYEGCRFADQVVSELCAQGASLRPFTVALNGVLNGLLLAAMVVTSTVHGRRSRLHTHVTPQQDCGDQRVYGKRTVASG